ncbi:MAG: M48 family metallopeptidase [Verrucomicrobia bacterium]|nr:M48 family metallopeptidase [Verrucomicrobiota bacterium]
MNVPFLTVRGETAEAAREVPLEVIRHPRARRYVVRVRADGRVRLTIPRGGSNAEGLNFLQRQQQWIERQLAKVAARRVNTPPAQWGHGIQFLFRGELVALVLDEAADIVRFAEMSLRVVPGKDLRPTIERHLRRLATVELTIRTHELARVHALHVRRVTVRNQRSRWGSCSRAATISLNWRLIQTPPAVRDYIILHELMHLREMNHSARFWQHVAAACPEFEAAEKWLKQNSALLRP